MRWLLILALVGCGRIGFEPVELDNGSAACASDLCSCPADEPCDHACTAGAAECIVHGGDEPVDVVCDDNAECHVSCFAAPSCEVECGGSASCRVICPPSGCAVTGCSGPGCVVTCGFTELATRDGTTARCD
jgi:hypothetical protein